MSVLGWIITTSLIGGLLSVGAAWLFMLAARSSWVPVLVSFAIGALLGAAFLEIIPHAFEQGGNPTTVAATLLAGILLFFVLEKLVLWRHCHDDHCEAHEPHLGGAENSRAGVLILVGDTFHNFVDGVLIAAAFMQDVTLGLITAMAVIAHEIPQEVGDFVVLLHSGFTRARALAFNIASSFATLAGGLLAYFFLSGIDGWATTLLALAASSMIYVAVADLIPGLHKRPEIHATVQQVLLIAAGIGSVWGMRQVVAMFVA